MDSAKNGSWIIPYKKFGSAGIGLIHKAVRGWSLIISMTKKTDT